MDGWEVRSSPVIGRGGFSVDVDEVGNFSIRATPASTTTKKAAAVILRLLAQELEEELS